jgi:hypothetical protein
MPFANNQQEPKGEFATHKIVLAPLDSRIEAAAPPFGSSSTSPKLHERHSLQPARLHPSFILALPGKLPLTRIDRSPTRGETNLPASCYIVSSKRANPPCPETQKIRVTQSLAFP